MKTLSSLGSLLLTGSLAAAVLVQAPAHATHDHGRHGPSATRPHLDARATLSADYPRSRPAVRRQGHTGQRPHGPVRRPGHPRLLRPRRAPGRHVLGDARQRLRRQGATRPTSCCGSTTSRRDWETARGGAGQHRASRDFISLATRTTGSTSRSSTRARRRGCSPVPTSTSSRCSAAATAPSGSATSSARSCCTSTRAGRLLAPPVAVPARQVAAEPDARPGETPNVAGQRRLRGDGPVARTAATSTRSWRGALVDDPDPAPPDHLRVRHHGRTATPARTWAYQVDTDANLVADAQLIGRQRLLRPRARRLRRRRRGDQAGLPGQAAAAPTAAATSPSPWSSTCSSIANPDQHRRRRAGLGHRRPVLASPSSRSRRWCRCATAAADRQRQQLPGQRRPRPRARPTTPR